MKKVVVSIFYILTVFAVANVFAQRETPAGAGDKNLADDGIKMRSVEMERMKQESKRAEAALFAPINTQISDKFPQIKEDFEGIQVSQDAVIKAYTIGKTVDYRSIEKSADEILAKAKRLDSNLFAAGVDKKNDLESSDKTKEKVEKPKSIRDLIVEMDNTVGSFVSSKIFANIKIIEPDVAIKTRKDLLSIIQLSENLSLAAKQTK